MWKKLHCLILFASFNLIYPFISSTTLLNTHYIPGTVPITRYTVLDIVKVTMEVVKEVNKKLTKKYLIS